MAQRYIILLYGMPEYNKMRKLARTSGQEQERSNKMCPNKIEEPARRRRDIIGMCK